MCIKFLVTTRGQLDPKLPGHLKKGFDMLVKTGEFFWADAKKTSWMTCLLLMPDYPKYAAQNSPDNRTSLHCFCIKKKWDSSLKAIPSNVNHWMSVLSSWTSGCIRPVHLATLSSRISSPLVQRLAKVNHIIVYLSHGQGTKNSRIYR